MLTAAIALVARRLTPVGQELGGSRGSRSWIVARTAMRRVVGRTAGTLLACQTLCGGRCRSPGTGRRQP